MNFFILLKIIVPLFLMFPFFELVIYWDHHRKVKKYFCILSLIYLVLLSYAVFFPFTTPNYDSFKDYQSLSFKECISFIQYKPFSTVKDSIRSSIWLTQIVGNILLLFPLPFIKYVYSDQKAKTWQLVLLGFITSLYIETLQFIVNCYFIGSHRVSDVDDVILNTLGALIAALLILFLQKKRRINNFIRRITLQKE